MIELEPRFHIIRTTVEAAVPQRGIVLVTSAVPGDGKSYLSAGVARAFAEAGDVTALVDLNDENPGVAEQLGIGALAPVRDPAALDAGAVHGGTRDLFALSLLDHRRANALSATTVAAGAQSLRDAFAFTVLDGGCITESNATLQFARVADGVLIAVREGRSIRQEDRDLMPFLERMGCRVLGVVLVHADARHAGAPAHRLVRQPRPEAARASL